MSTWDDTVFAEESNAEFLDDCDDLEGEDLVQALTDASTLALNTEGAGTGSGNPDLDNGLCAATVAAIWSGAPFTAATTADEHPFIRERIGQCPDTLQEAALQLLDRELEEAGEDAPDGLETFVEALS
ncbi:MAG: DUF4259 domain-containing protein [Mycobacteriaceae bacterium]|uniref:DUF4259 domain-containing protein n=1 Tax=Corynebacterium sp. TaxID=1720 RepID=UPI003F949577